MPDFAISVNLSGEDFDPDLLLSRLSLPVKALYKNKPTDMKPFGDEHERGKVPYGYGSLTLLDTDVLGHPADNEQEVEEFVEFLASFFDVLEEYGVQDSRLTFSVGYGQQCNFRLSRDLLLAIARLGQGLSLTIYQDKDLHEAEKENLPNLSIIASQLEVNEQTFIHILKPHIINSSLYNKEEA